MSIIAYIDRYWPEWISGVLATVSFGIFSRIIMKFKKMQLRQAATELGVQALLRAEIIQIYNKYMEAGAMPIYERENAAELFSQYTNLGGNGVIKELIEKLNDLPTPHQS